LLLAAAVLLLAGCSGGGDDPASRSEPEQPSEQSSGPSVAGDYDTAVELLENSCPAISVMDNPTIVTQEDDSVSLAHAGVSYVAPLEDDGSFVTAPAQVAVGADTHTLTVTGRFHDDGFDAQVRAVVSGSMTCGYTVGWTGTRQ
jgi:hypothetical protein